jgi:hypothetical protein
MKLDPKDKVPSPNKIKNEELDRMPNWMSSAE